MSDVSHVVKPQSGPWPMVISFLAVLFVDVSKEQFVNFNQRDTDLSICLKKKNVL